MMSGAIVSIPISVCIFLQKNWPIDRRVQAALYTTICLIFAVGLVFVPYYLFLLSNHRRYDNAEYTFVYIDRKLIWSTCIGLFIVLAMLAAFTIDPVTGIANSPKFEKFHIFMILLSPPLKTSAFFALIVQILVCIQKSWSLSNKIINIVVIEVVFVSIGSIFGLTMYLAEYNPVGFLLLSLYIIPFIPFITFTGCVLLRHIFIKSSPNLEEFHVFIAFVLPLSIISAFVALRAQILVWRQESWSLRNKIINIIVIEVVFVSIGSMVGLAMYLAEYIPPIFLLLLFAMPFTGVVLLRHIFIKSSLDALERKE